MYSGRRVGLGEGAYARIQSRCDALFICRIPERDVQRDDEADVVFFARVHALFGDFASGDLPLRAAEFLGSRLREGFVCIFQRNLDIVKSEHNGPF